MTALGGRAEAYRPAVQREMRAVIGDSPEPLMAWLRYHLGWEDAEGRPVDASPGKMLNPAGTGFGRPAVLGAVPAWASSQYRRAEDAAALGSQ